MAFSGSEYLTLMMPYTSIGCGSCPVNGLTDTDTADRSRCGKRIVCIDRALQIAQTGCSGLDHGITDTILVVVKDNLV